MSNYNFHVQALLKHEYFARAYTYSNIIFYFARLQHTYSNIIFQNVNYNTLCSSLTFLIKKTSLLCDDWFSNGNLLTSWVTGDPIVVKGLTVYNTAGYGY